MARRPITFESVKAIALDYPDTELGTSYGSPAVKANGRVMTCRATNKSAEPGSLVVRVGFAERDELVRADPDVYYLTPHYVPWPSVLVRMSRIHTDALKDLLGMAYRYCQLKPRPTRRRPPARPRGRGARGRGAR